MLHDFVLAGERVRLWQRPGEGYEHVLMKALGHTMYVRDYPRLEIERAVGLRYKPDLVALSEDGRFRFWGECGLNSIRKTAWLLKHASPDLFVLFKMERGGAQLVKKIRETVLPRYRAPGSAFLVNFSRQVIKYAETEIIEQVPEELYAITQI
jgi:hypothetical protein